MATVCREIKHVDWWTAWLCWGKFRRRLDLERKAFMSLQMSSVGGFRREGELCRGGISLLNNASILLNKTAVCACLWGPRLLDHSWRDQKGTSSKPDLVSRRQIATGSWTGPGHLCKVECSGGHSWNISKEWVFCCSRESTWRSTGDISWRSLEDEELCLPHKHTLSNHHVSHTHSSLKPLRFATCIYLETH